MFKCYFCIFLLFVILSFIMCMSLYIWFCFLMFFFSLFLFLLFFACFVIFRAFSLYFCSYFFSLIDGSCSLLSLTFEPLNLSILLGVFLPCFHSSRLSTLVSYLYIRYTWRYTTVHVSYIRYTHLYIFLELGLLFIYLSDFLRTKNLKNTQNEIML